MIKIELELDLEIETIESILNDLTEYFIKSDKKVKVKRIEINVLD
ncbi:hypothetical protein ES702_02965 [subsurface metagenome]